MDRLYTPWRYDYVTGQIQEEGCIFCNRLQCDDAEQFVLHRGQNWYVILNRYPYNNGHLLIAPLRHIPDFDQADDDEMLEMNKLVRDYCLKRKVVRFENVYSRSLLSDESFFARNRC